MTSSLFRRASTCVPVLRSVLPSILFCLSWASSALAFLPGCGSNGDSLDKSCAILAQAQCERRQTCTNTTVDATGKAIHPEGVFILSAYGDMPTCLARQHMACLENANAPGTGTSAGQLEKCASEYGTWSCSDLFDGNANPPPDCAPPGTRANGELCAVAGQCASRFCAGTKNATCGTCADLPADGASCASSGCAPGQTCKVESTSAQLCRDRLPVGDASCTADSPCQAFSSCVGASTTNASKTGTCAATALTVGAACGGANNPTCENNVGLACLGPTGNKTCQPIALVQAAAACGTLADGSRAACVGSDCFTATGPAAVTDNTATCIARAADGAACDTQLGPSCLTPARCVTSAGSTAGTCVVPDASFCK